MQTQVEQSLLTARYAAGRIAAQCLQKATAYTKPGVTTLDIDKICHDYITSCGASAECIGYKGYKHASCISVNDVVCHGVPGAYVIKDGDIVNVDIVVRYNGHLADTSTTILVGNVCESWLNLVKTAQNAMYAGMSAAKYHARKMAQHSSNQIDSMLTMTHSPNTHSSNTHSVMGGMMVCEIGNAIHKYVDHVNGAMINASKHQKYSLVPGLCSHGIGKNMHENPLIQNCRNNDTSIIPIMQCFTVEPIVKLGQSSVIYTEPDKWTIRTKDAQPATQFENTMCIDSVGKLHIFTTIDDAEEQRILKILDDILNPTGC
jgi:methionyl aminopeptidase